MRSCSHIGRLRCIDITKAENLAALIHDQFNEVTNYVTHVCYLTNTAIEQYFVEIGRAGACYPRFCMKSLAGENIVDSFRTNKFELKDGYINPIASLSLNDNSAFNDILRDETCSFVHIPDVPQMFYSSEHSYTNSRLEHDAVSSYLAKRVDGKNIRSGLGERNIKSTDDENTFLMKIGASAFGAQEQMTKERTINQLLVVGIYLNGIEHAAVSKRCLILRSILYSACICFNALAASVLFCLFGSTLRWAFIELTASVGHTTH